MGELTPYRIAIMLLCLLAAVGAAGCNTTDSPDSESERDRTDIPTTTLERDNPSGEVFAVQRVTPDEPPQNPINVSELPDQVRRKVVFAIEDKGCVTGEPSLQDDLINRSAQNQYLVYDGSYYGVFYRKSDVIYASTAPSQDCSE